MIQYKRKDIGLYIALALVGAGTGLLAGALVASVLKRRRALQLEWADSVIETDDGLLITGHIDVPEVKNWTIDVEEVDQGEDFEDEDTTEEMVRFIEQYEPTPIQIGMIESGLFTIEQMIEVIEEGQEVAEDLLEPYSYSAPYKPKLKAKPDLDDLVDEKTTRKLLEDQMIDDRFIVFSVDKDDDFEFNTEFAFNPEGPQWVFLSGYGNTISLLNISKFIPSQSWPKIEAILIDEGDICVEDFVTKAKYRFYLSTDEDESGIDSEEYVDE